MLLDALNSRIPAIYDETYDAAGRATRELNAKETEAAKERLQAMKLAFEDWVWRESTRADELARLYNDGYNNLVNRRFDGSHLKLPGAVSTFRFYQHQKNAIWRMISAGSTYVAHAVGAGKTASIAAAIMEQRRLGLITKAVLTVPGHCLAQCAREFLALYPLAKILVADEQNFACPREASALPCSSRDRRLGLHHHHALGVQVHSAPGRFRDRNDGADDRGV